MPDGCRLEVPVRPGDVRGLTSFLETYDSLATQGFVVTMGRAPERLSKRILAIPWTCL